MDMGERIAAEALALVGVPFRLRGRSAATGLDCVGLALLAATRAGARIGPVAGYHLRGTATESVRRGLRAAGLVPTGQARAGDILLAQSGPLQLHLMIHAGNAIVHAHAGLGRVVAMPLPDGLAVLEQWRFAANGE